MDPIVIVVVIAGSVLLAEQVAVLVTIALGDETARLAGRTWTVHHLVDRLGSVLVPAVLSVLSSVSLLGFGWAKAGPSAPGRLIGWRGALAALTAPAVHVLLALGGLQVNGLQVNGLQVNGGAGFGLLVFLANGAIASFLLLPLPMLPGGRLVAPLLRGELAVRWMRWSRLSRSIPGVPVALVVAWLVATEEPIAYLAA